MKKEMMDMLDDIRKRKEVGYRIDDEDWITINGTHVMVGENGELKGNVGEKVRKSVVSDELQRHFDKENKRVADFMKKKVGTGQSIEMDNGQILEHYSMDEMKKWVLQESKDNGVVFADTQIAILYKNGDIAVYGEGDDTSKMRLSNIKGVIYENESTSAYAGTGIVIENYNETCAGDKGTRYGSDEEEDDWRIDFE